MSSSYFRTEDGNYLIEEVETDTQTVTIDSGLEARHLLVSVSTTETGVTVAVEVVDGISNLDDSRSPEVVAYDGQVDVVCGDIQRSISVSNGLGSVSIEDSNLPTRPYRVEVSADGQPPVRNDSSIVR